MVRPLAFIILLVLIFGASALSVGAQQGTISITDAYVFEDGTAVCVQFSIHAENVPPRHWIMAGISAINVDTEETVASASSEWSYFDNGRVMVAESYAVLGNGFTADPLCLPREALQPGDYTWVPYLIVWERDTQQLYDALFWDNAVYEAPRAEAQASGCQLDIDHDCDTMPNDVEQLLIDTFKPFLYFDENEPEDYRRTVSTIFQVTPLYLRQDSDPEYDAAIITMVVLYQNDNGIQDMNVEGFENHVSCNALTLNSGALYAADALLPTGMGSHPGDTEAVKLYVNMDGGWSNTWFLEGAWLKQHYNPWEWYRMPNVPVSNMHQKAIPSHGDLEVRGNSFILYVSQGKHAMYESHSACENEEFKVEIPILDIPTTCDITFENCSGGALLEPYTPFEHNVGEVEHKTEVFENSTLLQQLYPGESAWGPGLFCGGYQGIIETSSEHYCAGSISGKWEPGVIY